MPTTFGARGEDGHNLVRDMKKFKEKLAGVNFEGRKKRKPDTARGGKKTYKY